MRSRRREIRKKGFILSFGDIILPLVGIVAIGLLVVAGKVFFMNGLRPSVSIVPEKVPESPMPQISTVSVPATEARGEVAFPDAPSGQPKSGPTEAPHIVAPAQEEKPLTLEITATPVAETPAKKEHTSKPVEDVDVKPASKPQAQGPAWRVQVGAYGSKSGANEIVSKLAKAGYKASVYSGTKYHKVWVQAGNTKQSAEAVASRLKKAGFPGSYVVPPPPSR